MAATTRRVLSVWGNTLEIAVTDEAPANILAHGADAPAAAAARAAHFAWERACPPICEGTLPPKSFPEGAEFGSPCAPSSDELLQSAFDTTAEGGQKPVPAERAMAEMANRPSRSLRVMKDGTLPHFVPDRRERLLDALAQLGEPKDGKLATRLWGAVVIDGAKCVSCRMCATFCPTAAIARFDDADGTLGVTHRPADCVKCGSCRDICPADAIVLLDAVPTSWLVDGSCHRYAMAARPVSLVDNPHQILGTFRQTFNGDIFER